MVEVIIIVQCTLHALVFNNYNYQYFLFVTDQVQ